MLKSGELQTIFEQEVENFSDDFGKTETAVKELMNSFGKGLLQRLVNKSPNGYKGSSIVCQCGGSMNFIQHRKRDIHSVFGWITLKRAYYYCPDCGSSVCPYDSTSGLGSEQLSPGLAKACSLLAIDESFERTSRKIDELLGQNVSDTTIERLTEQVGSIALQQQDQMLEELLSNKRFEEPAFTPKRLYVAADGTTVHETDGWHEAKAGVLYWENQRKERESRYIGRFDNSVTFGNHLWLEACNCGLRQAEEIIFLGDGAPWIRNEKRRHFGRATFIIDWYHASEHIWDCSKELFGEGTKATEKWVEKRLDWLWDGWTKKLLDNLKEQQKKHRRSKRKEISDLIRYISNNEEHMRYDVFRAKGYDIGSGSVEGACKSVVGKRLKQSGMIWKRAGSSTVLALRIVWLNGQWKQFWQKKPMAA